MYAEAETGPLPENVEVNEFSLGPGPGLGRRSPAEFARYLAAAASAGFSGVSLSSDQIGDDVAETARLLSSCGLRCPDVLGLRVGRDDAEAIETAERVSRTAAELNADFVLSLLWTRANEEVIDRLGRCADIVAKAGPRLVLEMPPIGPINRISAVLAVAEAVGTDRISLVIEPFHFFRGESTWDELESLPLEALGYVQFTDALAPGDDVVFDATQRRAMPGEGVFDLARFADTLRTRGWSGLVSVEVLSEDLQSLDPAEFARRAYASSAPYWGL